eukprot:198120_1
MDEKEDDSIGRGIWKIKTSDLSIIINSYNPESGSRKRLVSPLIHNSKLQIVARISVYAQPTNNGQVSLQFQMNSSHSNYSSCLLQIKCDQPYFDKTNNTSYSVSHTIAKSSLLSPSIISITYSMKTPKGTRCFSSPSDSNYNQYNQSRVIPSNAKPIPFEFTVTSSSLKEVASKAAYQGSYDGTYFLKSIRDPMTNTAWGIYLVCGYYQRQYSIMIQPTHSKAYSIQAWVDIEAESIMFYQATQSTDLSKSQHHFPPAAIANFQGTNLVNETSVHFKGNIFGYSWKQQIYHGNQVTYVDITTDLFASGSTLDAVNDEKKDTQNELLMRKISEMNLQIQTLSTGLNNVLKVNRELKNENTQLISKVNKMESTMNRNQSELKNMLNENTELISKVNKMESTMNTNQRELKNMLDGIISTLSTNNNAINNKLSSMKTQLDNMGNNNVLNDDNKENVKDIVFDPVYATFYYWLNNTVCLPQYLDKFKTSGYDSMDAVVELNDNELQEMGINTKGHRVRLLKGIKKYIESKSANEGTNYI